jgi:chromosome segregation ATPase
LNLSAVELEQAAASSRQALQEREHLLTQIRHLSTEVDDLTAAKASAESRKLQAVRDADIHIVDARTAQLEAQRRLTSASQRVHALEGELRQADAVSQRLSEQIQSSRQEMHAQAARHQSEQLVHTEQVKALETAVEDGEAQRVAQLQEARAEAEVCERQLEEQVALARGDAERLRAEVRFTFCVSLICHI